MGLYFVIQMLLSFALGIIYGVQFAIENYGKHGKMDPVKMQTMIQAMLNHNILYILIGSILVALLIYMLIFKAKKKHLFRLCNFSAIKISNIGLAILLGAACNWSLTMVGSITSFCKLFPDHQKIMATLLGGNFVQTILIIGIMVPMFEEILFRGIVFNELRKHISLMAAVIIQGLIFGIYHMNLLQGIYGTIIGILAALIYIWLNSLWAPIFIHASFNILSVIMSRVGDDQIFYKYGFEILIFSWLILGLSIFLIWKNRIQVNDISVSGFREGEDGMFKDN
jgi:uncharacterized protein